MGDEPIAIADVYRKGDHVVSVETFRKIVSGDWKMRCRLYTVRSSVRSEWGSTVFSSRRVTR